MIFFGQSDNDERGFPQEFSVLFLRDTTDRFRTRVSTRASVQNSTCLTSDMEKKHLSREVNAAAFRFDAWRPTMSSRKLPFTAFSPFKTNDFIFNLIAITIVKELKE